MTGHLTATVSLVIWDHTVLPAIDTSEHPRLNPSQGKVILAASMHGSNLVAGYGIFKLYILQFEVFIESYDVFYMHTTYRPVQILLF